MFKNLTQSRQVAEAQRRGKGKIRLSFFVFLASPRPCAFALKSSYRHFRRERMVGNPGVPGTQGTLEIIFVSLGRLRSMIANLSGLNDCMVHDGATSRGSDDGYVEEAASGFDQTTVVTDRGR